jgi:MFS family permease
MNDKANKGVSVNIILLGIVSFLNDLSSEMIMPILPMFIESVGGAGIAIGFLGGLRDSITSILLILSGHWSDKTGKRKIFIYAGYAVSAVFKLFLGLSKTYPAAIAVASLERTGKGLRTAARDAIIADSMPAQRGKGFGIHRTLDTSGAILGSLGAFFLYWYLGFGLKFIILTAAALSFVSLIPIIFVKESGQKPQKISLSVGLKNLPSFLRLFIFVSAVFALANFSYMFFILRVREYFTGRLSIAAPILLYVLFNFVYALFSAPFGAISDRVGRWKVIIFVYVVFVLVCLGFAFFASLPAFIVLFALYGLSNAAIDSNQRAFVSDLASSNLKATALGAFHTAVGLAALPASLIAGLLWQKLGPQAAFIYGAIVAAASIFAFLLVGHGFRQRSSQTAATRY